MENIEQRKKILDVKIQQNNINLDNYKYYDNENAYVRFESGQHDGVTYKIMLDEKGYLTERYIDEGPACDVDCITVYDDECNRFYFTTLDDSYDYECKNGNLYYVGCFDDEIYGIMYHSEEINKGATDFRNVLFENKNVTFFKENKTRILNDYMEMHEKELENTCSLDSNPGVKGKMRTAFDIAKEELSDVLPDESEEFSDHDYTLNMFS